MILIDTNILVFAHNVNSPHHHKANQLLKDALASKIETCLAPQNLLEFFCVITNPKRIENPLSPNIARTWIETYINSKKIKKIYPQRVALKKVITIINDFNISKAEIFDSYLIATMETNNVKKIYTDNVKHFIKYSSIEAINPFRI